MYPADQDALHALVELFKQRRAATTRLGRTGTVPALRRGRTVTILDDDRPAEVISFPSTATGKANAD